jgi:hypothetical protein
MPKNRQPVGYQIVPKLIGEGYDVVPQFVNPPEIVSVGVQTNVINKDGRFKETRGVPSTSTRIMTKQEWMEACQDDEIEDIDIPKSMMSAQMQSLSSSSSSPSSSYSWQYNKKNG